MSEFPTREQVDRLVEAGLPGVARHACISTFLTPHSEGYDIDPIDLNPHLHVYQVCDQVALQVTEFSGLQCSREDVMLHWLMRLLPTKKP